MVRGRVVRDHKVLVRPDDRVADVPQMPCALLCTVSKSLIAVRSAGTS